MSSMMGSRGLWSTDCGLISFVCGHPSSCVSSRAGVEGQMLEDLAVERLARGVVLVRRSVLVSRHSVRILFVCVSRCHEF